MVSSDHGESLGELNLYQSHRIADKVNTHLPLIVKWPGLLEKRSNDKALHYHFDFVATMIELLGGEVPKCWDAVSFASALKNNKEKGRDYLVIEAGVGGLTRSVRFDDYLFMRVYHDGYNGLPNKALFNVKNDPHELNNLVAQEPELARKAVSMLEEWYIQMMETATHPRDPIWETLFEGGPQDMRGKLPAYLKRLRETGREQWAELLAKKYPKEC